MYEYLKNVQSPRHVVVAVSLLGTKEIAGAKSNEQILSWAKELGLGKIYSNDDTAWCGLFVAWCLYRAGRKVVFETKDNYDYLRARKYAEYGSPVEPEAAAFGDLLIFQRPEGGHVGFYVAEDKECYHVLGGNQGNRVSVVRIQKSRLVAVRRPAYISFMPAPMYVDAKGAVSSNEA